MPRPREQERLRSCAPAVENWASRCDDRGRIELDDEGEARMQSGACAMALTP